MRGAPPPPVIASAAADHQFVGAQLYCEVLWRFTNMLIVIIIKCLQIGQKGAPNANT